jgi:site-specific DNA-methyltransferase (adenine-specific)
VPYRCYCGDWQHILSLLPDGSVDALITDPPYGYNLDHWDATIDVASFSREVQRVVHPDGLYVVFGQMPTIFAWYEAAINARMTFLECIVWVKRIATPGYRLSRGYDVILLFAVGKRRKLYQSKGPYEDVKLPGVLVDVASLEGIDRYIKDLQAGGGAANRKQPRDNIYSRFDTTKSSRSPREINYTNVWSFLPARHANRTAPFRHPTEKPLPVMQRLVELCSQPGQVILDPFMGSGTTGEAAIGLARRFIGGENHLPFLAIAQERLQQVLGAQEQANLLPMEKFLSQLEKE